MFVMTELDGLARSLATHVAVPLCSIRSMPCPCACGAGIAYTTVQRGHETKEKRIFRLIGGIEREYPDLPIPYPMVWVYADCRVKPLQARERLVLGLERESDLAELLLHFPSLEYAAETLMRALKEAP